MSKVKKSLEAGNYTQSGDRRNREESCKRLTHQPPTSIYKRNVIKSTQRFSHQIRFATPTSMNQWEVLPVLFKNYNFMKLKYALQRSGVSPFQQHAIHLTIRNQTHRQTTERETFMT